MTWVFGWPLYDDDAIKIAKEHNLVKNPNANDAQRVQAARLWVADHIGGVPVLCCWVDNMPEVVYAAYIDYGNNRYPPIELVHEDTISRKQYRRLKRAMPLRDLGWYQHDDPSCELYEETVYEDVDDSDEESDEGSDTDGDEDSGEGGDNEVASMNIASVDEDTAESDNETVTDGAVSKSDLLPEGFSPSEAVQSLPTDFDARCTITEP
ncbi:uncharacterized protein B0H18DRAFT_135970 [Fomitopsis serialis]|uniref:uncharacterized protein n=1 Tax=Fomitopsis serialis TaxID=139415 RepID=UPI002007FB31|nr:uncharacterized protein B0H18DRAFT_135970 [Neoantrodia serialis]KAH9914432.1 hypothetical protein B0H18DRAFT_135970 [Neoantrodia serialis]